jgi:hypothetical protein
MDKIEQTLALLAIGMAEAQKEIEIVSKIGELTGGLSEKESMKYAFYFGSLSSYQNVYDTLTNGQDKIEMNKCEN